MPLPLIPLATFAFGTALLLSWRRGMAHGRTDQRAEDALDDMDEGLTLHRPADRTGQTNATARFTRRVTWGTGGVEVDAALLGRLRIRRF